MKKIWLIAVMLCSLLMCGICSAAPAKEKGMVIETDYYTLTAPASWKTDCVYEHGWQKGCGEHTLTVYDKSSRKQTEHGLRGGELFSIAMGGVYDDYTKWGRYEHLGAIYSESDVYGAFNLVVIYPSHREYTPRTEAKYKEMKKQIPAIIKSLKCKKGVTISKEVVQFYEPDEEQPYEEEEYYEEEAVEEVPQEEQKETIVDKAKKEISSFLGKLFKKK